MNKYKIKKKTIQIKLLTYNKSIFWNIKCEMLYIFRRKIINKLLDIVLYLLNINY